MNLDEIRKRCEAATAGDWAWQDFGGEICLTGQYGRRPIVLAGRLIGGLTNLVDGVLVPLSLSHPDSEFVAHARTDIPALIAAAEAADKLVASTSEFDPSDFPELWDAFDARRTAYLKVRGDI